MKKEIFKGNWETIESDIYTGHFGGQGVGSFQLISATTINNKDENIRSISFTEGYENSKDFERIEFKKDNSPCWVNVTMQRVRNNRNYEFLMSLGKPQLKLLIEQLTIIEKSLGEIPTPTKITQ